MRILADATREKESRQGVRAVVRQLKTPTQVDYIVSKEPGVDTSLS